MARLGLSEIHRWLEEECAGSPAALCDRVISGALAGPSTGVLPGRLVRSARAALESVLAGPGNRSVALDLLAADALVTLALKAQAAQAPEALESFAGELLGD